MRLPGIAAMLRFSIFCLAAAASVQFLPAQAPSQAAVPAASPKPVPVSFRAYRLGMSTDELKTALAADELFVFRGDRDVSLLALSDQVLIETTGLSFIRRAFFQLRDGKVFMMAFSLDTQKVDHYSVFSSMVAGYGEPASLDPREAVWISDASRVSVERPLTVKYIDRVVFDELARDASVKQSKEHILREEFLSAF